MDTHQAAIRLASLRQYLEHTPDNLPLLIDAISTAITARSLEDAEELVGQALSYAPDSGEVHAHAGYIAMLGLNFSSAVSRYERSLELGVSGVVLKFNLSFSYFRIGLYEESLSVLAGVEDRELVEHNLLIPAALLAARCHYRKQEFAKGLEKLGKLPEQNAEVLGLQALLSCDGEQVDEGLAFAEKCLVVDKDNFEALISQATCLVIKGRYDEAYGCYTRITELYPTVGRAWSGLGQIQFYRFQFEEALFSLEKAVEFMGDHVGTWHLLGWVYMSLERYTEALNAFESAYELDRSFAETHGCFATLYALTGETAKAERHIKLAQKLDPASMGHAYAQMLLLQRQGRSHESQTLFDKALATPNPLFGGTLGKLVDRRLQELKKLTDGKPEEKNDEMSKDF